MSIISEIKKNQARAFRRIYMKRRTADDYETDWQEIPIKYIRSYGSIDFGIEGIKVNFFKFSGYNFTVDNVDGYFSDVNDDRSFFYKYACVPRTMIKIEAGYEANDGTEYPTNSTLFIGLIGGNLDFSSNNLMKYKCDHLSKVFEEFNAAAIPNMNGNYTAGEVIEKIRDYQDGNSVGVFQKYISSGAWTIETTTTQYPMATNTTLEDISCWDLMTKLAEAENKVLDIDRTGGFSFIGKVASQSIPVFHFSGLGDGDRSYGHNTMDIANSKKYNKVYNRIRIKFDSDNTNTSYYTKSESWNWGDSTSSYLYGVKTYKIENEFIGVTSTALTIANTIYDEYSQPKYELNLKTKFVPHLNLNDLTDVTYKTKKIEGSSLWGYFNWGEGFFGNRVGYNINIDKKKYRLIKIKHNIDNFFSTVGLREV